MPADTGNPPPTSELEPASKSLIECCLFLVLGAHLSELLGIRICWVRAALISRAASCHLRYFVPTSTAICDSVSAVPLRACSTVFVFSATALRLRPQSKGSQLKKKPAPPRFRKNLDVVQSEIANRER